MQPAPTEMIAQRIERGVDEGHLARPPPLAMIARRAKHAGPSQIDERPEEGPGVLLGFALLVERREVAVQIADRNGPADRILPADRVALKKDDGIERGVEARSAVDTQRVSLAIDLNPDPAGRVSPRWVGRDAIQHVRGIEVRLVAQLMRLCKDKHASTLPSRIASRPKPSTKWACRSGSITPRTHWHQSCLAWKDEKETGDDPIRAPPHHAPPNHAPLGPGRRGIVARRAVDRHTRPGRDDIDDRRQWRAGRRQLPRGVL